MLEFNEEITILNKDLKSKINLKAFFTEDSVFFEAYHASKIVKLYYETTLIDLSPLKPSQSNHSNYLNCLNTEVDIENTLNQILQHVVLKYKLQNIEITGIDDVSKIFRIDVVLRSLKNLGLTSIDITKS